MIDRWLVFFTPAPPGWWSFALHPKFQHVAAAGYDLDTDTWCFVDPGRAGTVVTLERGAAANGLLGALAFAASPHVLRVTAEPRRRMAPPLMSCTAAIKALTGSRSRALTPRGLYRDLKAAGAEPVALPCVGGAAEGQAPSAHVAVCPGPTPA